MSYRIKEVKDAFDTFFNKLNNSKLLFDKNDMSDDVNVIYDLCTHLYDYEL